MKPPAINGGGDRFRGCLPDPSLEKKVIVFPQLSDNSITAKAAEMAIAPNIV